MHNERSNHLLQPTALVNEACLRLIHPGLLWVEIESAAAEVEGCFEVVGVSVSADSSFDGHDSAIDAFGDGVRDSVSAIAHYVG